MAAVYTWFELERDAGRGWYRYGNPPERHDSQVKAEADATKSKAVLGGSFKVVKVTQTRETVGRF